MAARLVIALSFALMAAFTVTGVGEAAKGPDATEVGVGTVLVVLGVMAFLSLVYVIKGMFGGTRMPPPEEPAPGGHH